VPIVERSTIKPTSQKGKKMYTGKKGGMKARGEDGTAGGESYPWNKNERGSDHERKTSFTCLSAGWRGGAAHA